MITSKSSVGGGGIIGKRACAAAVAMALWAALTPAVTRAAILTPEADAEIREDQPELARGFGALPTTPNTGGGITELSIRVTTLQNRASIVRFDLGAAGITSPAQLQGFADLRLFSRNSGLGGTNAGGIKIYGLLGGAPLASTWDEQTVHYRDAGDAEPVSPTGGHPRSQPSVVGLVPGTNPPPAPIPVSNPPSWNSASVSTRAPGLIHENPAYSAAAEAENQARYQRNLDRHNGTLTGDYEPYINQPRYMEPTATTAYPDLASYDRPGATVGADLDPANTTFLGYLNYDAKSPSRPAGTLFSLTTGAENSPVTMNASIFQANRQSLVQYLTDLLNGGYSDATFLIFQKNNIDLDPAPIRSDNLIFASKEHWPTGGNIGDLAPQLVIAPEPNSIAILAVAAAGVLRRGSRHRGSCHRGSRRRGGS